MRMYFICKSSTLRFVSIGLVSRVLEHAVSRAAPDNSLFDNDILDNDPEPNLFLDEPSLTNQLSNEGAIQDYFVADNPSADELLADEMFSSTDSVLADDLLIADAQSCAKASTKSGSRAAESCSNQDGTSDSDYTDEDERTLTDADVKNYWCLGNSRAASVAVCSVDPDLEVRVFHNELQSTLS